MDSLAVMWDMIWIHFFGGSLCNVVTSLSITSWKFMFHIKNGTWQCCGNSSAELDTW